MVEEINMQTLQRIRAKMNPSLREWLVGFGAVLSVTLFFSLLQSAHDGLVNRNREFDPQRWWYPIYRFLSENPQSDNTNDVVADDRRLHVVMRIAATGTGVSDSDARGIIPD